MSARRIQSGFAAVAAIFLVVGLAALGAFMVSLSNTQQITAAQDVVGVRAYWAARAGLEWGVASAQAASACPASPTTLAVDAFSVNVQCRSTAYAEAGSTVTLFELTARASTGSPGTLGYVERSVSASLEK